MTVQDSFPMPSSQRPDYVAGVSMDIELGQRLQPGEVIDFDYDTFYTTAKALGASDEDIEKLHVDITDPSYRSTHTGGVYRREHDETPPITEVVFRGTKKKQTVEMNKSLVHELKHYIDDRQDILLPVTDKYLRGAEATTDRKQLIVYLAGASAVGWAYLAEKPLLATGLSLVCGGYAAVKQRQVNAYLRNPSELRAKAAEKTHGQAAIITVS